MADKLPAEPVDWLPHWQVELGDCPSALAWVTTGLSLAAASLAGDVVVVEVANGLPRQVAFHDGGALCLDWADDRLVSGGQDGTGTIDGDRFELGGWVAAAAVSRCGRHVALAHGRNASVLDAATGVTLFTAPHDSTVASVCWNPTEPSVLNSGSFGRIAQQRVGAEVVLPDIELEFGARSRRSGRHTVGHSAHFDRQTHGDHVATADRVRQDTGSGRTSRLGRWRRPSGRGIRRWHRRRRSSEPVSIHMTRAEDVGLPVAGFRPSRSHLHEGF